MRNEYMLWYSRRVDSQLSYRSGEREGEGGVGRRSGIRRLDAWVAT